MYASLMEESELRPGDLGREGSPVLKVFMNTFLVSDPSSLAEDSS